MFTVTDLFCGAGGSGLGASSVPGVQLKLAVNHWQLAVDTHQANFPSVDHDVADISQVDPRRYRRTNILWASPECTHHSITRGNNDDREPDLFSANLPTKAAFRSRSTMFDVHRFAEYHHYDAIIVENVVEAFAKWTLRRAWFMGLEDLGYDYQVVSLNSMHAPAIVAPRAPQSRDRAYCVAWRKGNRVPDLDIRPAASCVSCGRVEAVQWWKRQTSNPIGKYRAQYLYRCPHCHEAVEPDALPAASIIDWSLVGQRLGDRTVPLKPATLARIQAGLDRYAGARFITTLRSGRPQNITLAEALPTQTAQHETSLVVPYYGTGRAHPPSEPLHTVPTRDRFGVAFIAELRGGGSTARDIAEPLATVTASGTHHMLVRNNGCTGDPAYLSTPVTEPARTITTAGHQSIIGWASEPPAIEDCTFRMLTVPEIAGAMAFTPDYVIKGNKREKVRQLGNAVTPPAAEWLFRAVVNSLGGDV